MPEAPRAIFRGAAVRRYLQGRDESILPRFIRPPVFVCLWLLLGLSGAGGLVAWLTEVPVYATGSAVVVDGRASGLGTTTEPVVVTFLPPEHLSRLRAGQKLFLRGGEEGGPLIRPVVAVDTQVYSPDGARRRFGLGPGTAHAITRPSAVVMAQLSSRAGRLPAEAHVGSIYDAEIEVGSRRVMSFVPLADRLTGAE